ncbi:hypothetical protein CHH62_08975 [Niallia circulans]|nr:hypothetical protein CHH62_08975 [Niallia circulans]
MLVATFKFVFFWVLSPVLRKWKIHGMVFFIIKKIIFNHNLSRIVEKESNFQFVAFPFPNQADKENL